ncbi:peptidase S41 family [Cordyceps militaris]|uniref:Peptidase S41 family n=1 Tax=Cordyceps militaris TaxID=73501 RepID=A0A2H4SW94_CORMI|nr:peptidase S41 family [Cordyceps militaris]
MKNNAIRTPQGFQDPDAVLNSAFGSIPLSPSTIPSCTRMRLLEWSLAPSPHFPRPISAVFAWVKAFTTAYSFRLSWIPDAACQALDEQRRQLRSQRFRSAHDTTVIHFLSFVPVGVDDPYDPNLDESAFVREFGCVDRTAQVDKEQGRQKLIIDMSANAAGLLNLADFAYTTFFPGAPFDDFDRYRLQRGARAHEKVPRL